MQKIETRTLKYVLIGDCCLQLIKIENVLSSSTKMNDGETQKAQEG